MKKRLFNIVFAILIIVIVSNIGTIRTKASTLDVDLRKRINLIKIEDKTNRESNQKVEIHTETEALFIIEDLIKEALLKQTNTIDVSYLNIPLDWESILLIPYFSPYLADVDCYFFYYDNCEFLSYIKLYPKKEANQFREYFTTVDAILENIKLDVSYNQSKEDIALMIHEQIVNMCEYDYDNYVNNTIPDCSYKSAGVLVQNKAVCNGYAYAYKYLMNMYGVECEVISSYDMNHAWNIVQIDGSNYHVDCTWDDPTNCSPGLVSHKYFLLSDKKIKEKNHFGWDKDYLKCDNNKYDEYYWNDISSQIIKVNASYYYIQFSSGNGFLVKRTKDNVEQLVSLGKWQVWGKDGWNYSNNVGASIAYENNNIYYNSQSQIIKYNIISLEKTIVTSIESNQSYLYGFKKNKSSLEYFTGTDPNQVLKSNIIDRFFKTKTSNIMISDNSVNIQLGDMYKIYAVSVPLDENKNLLWKSENEKVVSVDNQGNIKAHKVGTTKIIITSDDGYSKVINVVVEKNMDFIDVNKSDWYYNTVKEINNLELMTGVGEKEFSPNSFMSRGMVATVIYRIANTPSINYETIFEDVKNGHFYSMPIIWATKNKILSGYNSQLFGPDDGITREQLAVILRNYVQSLGVNTSVKNHDLSKFHDYRQISPFALTAMQWVTENGIMNGTYDGKLNPNQKATRAECAKMLLQTYKLLNN